MLLLWNYFNMGSWGVSEASERPAVTPARLRHVLLILFYNLTQYFSSPLEPRTQDISYLPTSPEDKPTSPKPADPDHRPILSYYLTNIQP